MYLEEAVSRVKIAQDIIPLSAARPGLCLNHFNALKTEKVIRKYFPAIPDYVLEDSLQRGMCNIHGVNAARYGSCVIAEISPEDFIPQNREALIAARARGGDAFGRCFLITYKVLTTRANFSGSC